MDNSMKKIKRLSFLILVPFVLIMCNGCGYSTGSLLPANVTTIYIDNFKNKIDISKEVTESLRYTLYRPGLESDVTNEVVERFVFDGNLRIRSEEDADLMLKGDLIYYGQAALRYDQNDNVEEYRIRITVNMELIETETEKVLWKEVGFSGESTYRTTGRLAKSEDVAREEALEDLARRIVERTVENW